MHEIFNARIYNININTTRYAYMLHILDGNQIFPITNGVFICLQSIYIIVSISRIKSIRPLKK